MDEVPDRGADMASVRWSRWPRNWRGDPQVDPEDDESAESALTMVNFLRNRWFGIALVAASLIALVLSGYSSYQTRTYSQCQSMVTEALIQASIARSDAAEEDRRSDRDESRATALLIQTVFTATTVDERIAAYNAYATTLASIDQKRQETADERARHPLPQPPSQTCA